MFLKLFSLEVGENSTGREGVICHVLLDADDYKHSVCLGLLLFILLLPADGEKTDRESRHPCGVFFQ